MEIFLIVPPLSCSGSWDLSPRFPPYITASVAAHLRKSGFSVRIFDAFLEKASFKEVLLEVDRYRPDVIGISLAEVNREVALDVPIFLSRYLRDNRYKNTMIAFGSRDLESLRRYAQGSDTIDYYIAGDPEETIVELATLLSQNAGTDSFVGKGLLYKREDKVFFTGENILDDLNKLEFPAWDLVGLSRYFTAPHRYREISFYPLVTSRGCRWDKCIFCMDKNNIMSYQPYRVKSPRRIIEEINYACSKYGCKEIQFCDQQFNTDKQWLLELESELRRQNTSINWSCLSRIDMVNPEALAIMHRAGCWNILFGIESGSEQLLKVMNKGITQEQIRTAVSWCKNEGIEVTGSFLIGLPEEKPDDIFETVNFAHQIGIDYAQFFIAKWLKEHKGFESAGRVSDQWDYAPYDLCGRIFIPNAYKGIEHLKWIQRLAYLKFYLHPKVILSRIKKINNIQSFKRLLNAARVLFELLRPKKKIYRKQPHQKSNPFVVFLVM
jgi:anaerobic magnesium-protoporphyrin IX monomethyl ester cyclase